jgi:hypothetical protein
MSDSAQKVIGTGLIIAGVIASGGLGLAAVASYGSIMVVAGSLIYGAASQRQAKADAEAKSAAAKAAAQAAFLAGLKDRTATSIGTEQYHRTLYGTVKVGGNIVAMFTSGAHDEFKTCVVVFANHEINAYTRFWVAGKYVGGLDGSGWVAGGVFYDASPESNSATFTTTTTIDSNYVPGSVNVYYTPADGTVASKPVAYVLTGNVLTVATGVNATVSYQYIRSSSTGASRLNIRQHLGTTGEAADSYLTSTFPTQWTSQHTLNGHAYCVFTLDLRQAEFQGGPPSFQAEIQGKKLYDPRTSTRSYSENNALVLYDYLTGPYMKIPSTALPVSDYIAAANDCDDIVRTGAVYPQSNKRYTFNGVISSNESPKKVLEQIAMSMCGTVDGNSWSVYAGKYRAPIMTLSQDDIVGGMSVTPGLGYQGTYNTVRGQYVSPATDYVSTDFPPYVNSVYFTADGQEISTDSQQPYVNNVTGIYAIERIHMEDSRNGLVLTGDFSYKTWALRPGDRVLFSSPLLGMSSKIFRVTDKAVQFGTPIKLTLKEDAPEIWDQLDALVADQTPNSSLGDPFDVPLLPGLTAVSGTATLLRAVSGEIMTRILVTWQVANYQGASVVDIQWRRHVSSVWESLSTSADSSNTGIYLTGVIDGESYVIRARLRSASLNATGAWTYVDHTAIGKSEPPPDISVFTVAGAVLSWGEITDVPDLAGYRFRFQYGNNSNWNTAVPMHSGDVAHSPYLVANPPSGSVTLLAKAVDTSGNESVNPAVIYTDFGTIPVANTVQLDDLTARGYPGYIQGAVVSGINLIASGQLSFYGTGSNAFYPAGTGLPMYPTTMYSAIEYITTHINTLDSVKYDSNMFIKLNTTNASGLKVEYRELGTTAYYGADSASLYDPSSPFYTAGNPSFYSIGNPPMYEYSSFYENVQADWIPWTGSIKPRKGLYQFKVTMNSGTVLSSINYMAVLVDAPSITEVINDLAISSSGTPIAYTKSFTKINNVQATLQANLSGAVTVEIDKTTLTVRVYNSSHVAVSGASVDLTLNGY